MVSLDGKKNLNLHTFGLVEIRKGIHMQDIKQFQHLLQEKKWVEYMETMMVRNDWLQEHGQEPEYEMYLITNREYSDYTIVGLFKGVVGLEIKKIQEWFYRELVISSGIKYEEDRSKMWEEYSNYLISRYKNDNIETLYIDYLEKELRLEMIKVDETNIGGIEYYNFDKYLKPEPETSYGEFLKRYIRTACGMNPDGD